MTRLAGALRNGERLSTPRTVVKTWLQQKSDTENDLLGVSFVDTQRGWAIGHSGEILHTTDGGKMWGKQRSGVNRHLFGVHFIDTQAGWVVGQGGVILHTRNGGQKWGGASPTRRGLAVGGFTLQTISTVGLFGIDGLVIHTTDGGRIWKTPKKLRGKVS